jgi:transposase
MEATGRYSIRLWRLLMERRPELAPAIVNPKQAKHFHKSLGLRNKNDGMDSRSLGLLGKERKPVSYQELSPEMEKLRELFRYRQVLSDQLVAEGNRSQELSAGSPVRKFLSSHIRSVRRLMARLERSILDLLAANQSLQNDVRLLTSIPGVGQATALTVLAELGDLRRFSRSRQVSAMAGLSPSQFESAERQYPTRINKNGNSHVRKALYFPAITACRLNTRFTVTYQRLQANGLCKKAATVAVMRKLLVTMRALLISGETYREDYVSQRP